MIKHYINKLDKVPKDYYTSFLDSEVCANYDPLPSKTPLETILELQAGAEIRDNNLRKLYFGDQNCDSDVFEARDRYEEYMDEKIKRFQSSNLDFEASESGVKSDVKLSDDLTKSDEHDKKE